MIYEKRRYGWGWFQTATWAQLPGEQGSCNYSARIHRILPHTAPARVPWYLLQARDTTFHYSCGYSGVRDRSTYVVETVIKKQLLGRGYSPAEFPSKDEYRKSPAPKRVSMAPPVLTAVLPTKLHLENLAGERNPTPEFATAPPTLAELD